MMGKRRVITDDEMMCETAYNELSYRLDVGGGHALPAHCKTFKYLLYIKISGSLLVVDVSV